MHTLFGISLILYMLESARETFLVSSTVRFCKDLSEIRRKHFASRCDSNVDHSAEAEMQLMLGCGEEIRHLQCYIYINRVSVVIL